MLSGETSYLSFFKSTLARQMEKNPSYTMGALAKSTGISRSFLYDVLSGKKNLSPEAGARIAERLGLSMLEADLFSLLIQLETAKDSAFREGLLRKINALDPSAAIHDLKTDLFHTIADWYHLAILQLTELKDFRCNSRSISRKLGITIGEAEAALDRLLRLELLRKTESGGYVKASSRLLVQSEAPNEAVTRFHRQILERAHVAAGEQTRSERRSRSELIPLNPAILKEAEAILDRACEEIVALADRAGPPEAVYALSLHFFNLTRERN